MTDTKQFEPFVWRGYVVNTQECADTIAGFTDEQGDMQTPEQEPFLLGLLQKQDGFIPLTLGDAGAEARDIVLDFYRKDWKGTDGQKAFNDALYREAEFMLARKEHFGLKSATCKDVDRVLITTGHSAKPIVKTKWLNGTSIVRKDNSHYEVRIIETDTDVIEDWTLIRSARKDVTAKLVAFLNEREKSETVVELMKRVELVAGDLGFKLNEPPPVAVVQQSKEPSKHGGTYECKLVLHNGDAHTLSGKSSEIGVAAVALALAANPAQDISDTDRGSGNTKVGNWVPRARGVADFKKKWLREVVVTAD